MSKPGNAWTPEQAVEAIKAARARGDDDTAIEIERQVVTDTGEEDPGEVDSGE